MPPYRKSFGIWVPDRSIRDNRGFISPGIIGAVAGSRRRTAAAVGAITQDAVTNNNRSGAFADFTHTQGVLTNGCIHAMVAFTNSAGTPAPSATYNGVTMSRVTWVTRSNTHSVAIFKLDVAGGAPSAAGTNTISATLGGTVSRNAWTVISHNGVLQSTSFAYNQVQQVTVNPSVGVTAASDTELAICCGIWGGAITSSSQSQYQLATMGGYRAPFEYKQGTPATTTFSWVSANTSMAISLTSIKAA
jgi:hypothetical protein